LSRKKHIALEMLQDFPSSLLRHRWIIAPKRRIKKEKRANMLMFPSGNYDNYEFISHKKISFCPIDKTLHPCYGYHAEDEKKIVRNCAIDGLRMG